MKKERITDNIKISNDNLKKLRKDFPQCFDRNGNFDFEKFKKELLKSEIDFSKESYGMDWLGKSYARLLATDEATTLLKEVEEWNNKEENKNSQNILIKGDNLEVLKHLSNAYYEKIKMIYIDPPYNTGSDGFVYQDDRKFTAPELSKLAGIDEEKAKRVLDFVNSKSNSHSAWLTFMYPRLYIARQLLREDGVIFVSIDDNEVAQLRILMDEIFGEENFFATLVRRALHTVRNSSKDFNLHADFILVYAKNKSWFAEKKERYIRQLTDKSEKYIFNDNDGNGPYKLDPLYARNYYKPYIYKFNNGVIWSAPEGSYPRYSQEKLKKMEEEGRIIFTKKNEPKVKRYLKDVQDGQPPNTILSPNDVGFNSYGTQRLKECLGHDKVFSQPKPIELIKHLMNLIKEKNIIILDFFAGSGTTGDAVMQLNAEDGGNRKYILVQLPEPIDEKKNKTAYDFVKNELKVENPTIFEICKERLMRAGRKIKKEIIDKKIKEKEDEIKKLKRQLKTDETKEKIKQLEEEIRKLKNQDLGFKIFKTIPNDEGVWERYIFEAEEFNPQIKLFDESKLTVEDIKTLLTTWKTYDGIPLTQDLKEIDLDGYKGYYYETKLYLMDKGFKTSNLKKLLEEIDENKGFNPTTIIAFGYNFESKILREIAENVKNYANKKQIDVDFIIRH